MSEANVWKNRKSYKVKRNINGKLFKNFSAKAP